MECLESSGMLCGLLSVNSLWNLSKIFLESSRSALEADEPWTILLFDRSLIL